MKKINFKSSSFIFSILDQGFFSGSNFFLNLFLARFLTDADYGAFSYSFSFFILFSSILTSIVIEPSVVFGSKNKTNIKEFINKSLLLQILFSLIFCIIIIIYAFLQKQVNSTILIIMGVFFPTTMIFWLLRQSCYIEYKTKIAFLGSLIYFLSTTVGLMITIYYKNLSVIIGFVIMGCSGLIASIFLIIYNRVSIKLRKNFYSEINNFWNYGKWIIPASISNWLTTSAIIPLISFISTLSITGAYKALQNFYLPLQQFLAAIYLLLLPLLSETVALQDKRKIKKILVSSIFFLSTFAIIYLIVIITFSNELIQLVYNKQSFSESNYLSIFIGLSVVTVIPGHILSLLLRSIEKTQDIFSIKIINLIFFSVIGFVLISNFQLVGILITLVLLGLIESGSSLFFVLKRKKNI